MDRSPPLSLAAARIRPAVFAELQSRIDALAARGQDLVPLHIGDTHLAPPASARRALAAIDPDDASLYRYGPTAGLPALRVAIAKTFVGRGLEVDPTDEVLVGNGGTHALFCAARAVLDAGDEVLVATPYWPLATGVFAACGAIPVEVPLTQRLYADPSLDAGALLAAKITARTKAIYFISPNNPDGKVLSSRDLASIARIAVEHDLWVFADEVYAEAVFLAERTHVSIATLPGMRARTIVLASLSKSHALAGLRIGFAIAPGAVVASGRRVSTHSAFNVSIAMQRVALAALEDEAFPSTARAAYRTARDGTAAALAASKDVRFHLAEGGTYLMLDFEPAFRGVASERPLIDLLGRAVDRGVLLAPGDAFGDGYATCARLCFSAVPLDRVLAGVDRLLDAIAALRSEMG